MNEHDLHGKTVAADPFQSVACDDAGCRCEVCGLSVPGMTKDDLPLYHDCDQVKLRLESESQQSPELLQRVANFFKATGEHLVSGAKICSDDEIARRIEVCRSCDRFDKLRSWCTVCGCPISESQRFLSKLAWAEQSCPHPGGDQWASGTESQTQ